MTEWTENQKRDRTMIEARLRREGFNVEETDWRRNGDGDRPEVALGQWEVVEEDEDRGLYAGDRGQMWATCVGAEEYHNLQVKFYFRQEDYDEGGEQVTPFSDVEPVG